MIGAILMTVLGQIGNAIADTGEAIMEFTGSEEHIVIEDKHTFISAVRYTEDRAIDCDLVERNTYYGLEDTEYGENPRCAGVSGTMAAYLRNIASWTDTGGDMEGRNSRISFEISEDLEEDKILLESQKTYYEEDGNLKTDPEDPGLFIASFIGVSEDHAFQEVIDPECGSYYQNSRTNYLIAFSDFGGDGNVRTNHLGESKSLDSSMDVYCGRNSWMVSVNDRNERVDGTEGSFEVAICPGDEGYIQVNKEEPMNDGEASRDTAFPFVQIEDMSDEICVDEEFHDHEMKGYEGPQTGHQIYVKSQTSLSNTGDLREWPGVFNFELRQDDDIVEEIGQWESDITNRGEKCTIFYQRDANSLDEATERSYSKGTVVDQNQDTFEHNEGFTREQSSHRGISDGNHARTLIGDMSLDGGFVSTESQLRKSPEGLEGDLNELYGDLMCVEQSGTGYAAWEICTEDNKGEVREEEGNSYLCVENEWVLCEDNDDEKEGFRCDEGGWEEIVSEISINIGEDEVKVGEEVSVDYEITAQEDLETTEEVEFVVSLETIESREETIEDGSVEGEFQYTPESSDTGDLSIGVSIAEGGFEQERVSIKESSGE